MNLVVICGTSSKKSQQNFVPLTHPRTGEFALSTENPSKKVGVDEFYQLAIYGKSGYHV